MGELPILFVLGPSWAGKSSFGGFLAAEYGWYHLEMDQFPRGRGVDIHELRSVAYLYGSAADCIGSYMDRENATARKLGLRHWMVNNARHYYTMSRPELGPYPTSVFAADGTHLPWPVVFTNLGLGSE